MSITGTKWKHDHLSALTIELVHELTPREEMIPSIRNYGSVMGVISRFLDLLEFRSFHLLELSQLSLVRIGLSVPRSISGGSDAYARGEITPLTDPWFLIGGHFPTGSQFPMQQYNIK